MYKIHDNKLIFLSKNKLLLTANKKIELHRFHVINQSTIVNSIRFNISF
jgi:hypothetical protein